MGNGQIPLVTAKIVKAGKILPPNEFIAPEDYDSWMTRGLPEIDDIVLTTEAPLGEIALIKNKNVALAQRIITLRGKKDIVFNPFHKFNCFIMPHSYAAHTGINLYMNSCFLIKLFCFFR